MLTQSYDIILRDYLKRQLKPGDIVLDVGANVGYISAVAASCIQASGEVHGFEPLSECFARLERLRELNPGLRFTFNNVALSDAEGFEYPVLRGLSVFFRNVLQTLNRLRDQALGTEQAGSY
jgi:hypothetical protein